MIKGDVIMPTVKEQMIMSICMIVGITFAIKNWKNRKNKKSKHQLFIEKAERGGHFTTAVAYESQVILGNRESNNPDIRDHKRIVKYKYNVRGKDYTIVLSYPNTGSVIPDYDTTITVYYNPQDPDESHIKESETERDRNERGCLTSIATFFAITYGLFILLKLLLD